MEPTSIKNIAKKMFHLVDEDYEICSYGSTIYELYDELKKDSDLSIYGLLLEKKIIELQPGLLSKQCFSQIYLVFDFDPHYQKYSHDKILELLNFFQDETENGRIYINYPMFESAFYIDDYENPKKLYEKLSLDKCNGKYFKKEVRKITCFGEKNHIDLSFKRTEDIWYSIKWNYLKQQFITKQNNFIDYVLLLENQIKLLNEEKCIYVLSTFILLIVDYNPGILDFLDKQIKLK